MNGGSFMGESLTGRLKYVAAMGCLFSDKRDLSSIPEVREAHSSLLPAFCASQRTRPPAQHPVNWKQPLTFWWPLNARRRFDGAPPRFATSYGGERPTVATPFFRLLRSCARCHQAWNMCKLSPSIYRYKKRTCSGPCSAQPQNQVESFFISLNRER